MKKILSMILAMAMILSLSVTAFAENWNGETENNGNQFSGNVTANYTAPTASTPTVKHVVISWDVKGTATYTAGTTTYTWNTTGENALKYTSETTTGGWTITPAEEGGNQVITVEVTVTNYSNTDVSAEVAYEDKNDVTANYETATVGEKTMASAATGAKLDGSVSGAATSYAVTYTINSLNGTPTVGEGETTVVIGTFTVTLT